MASNVVKYWKEAATVVLIARSSKSSVNSLSSLDLKTKWNTVKPKRFDYKVLMLERSSKSKFMPTAYVFPGGMVSDVDFSHKWNDVFKTAGFKEDRLSNQPTEISTEAQSECPIFTSRTDWGLSSRAVFRINAIRETFEESGILVYQPWNKSTKTLDKSVLKEWRSTVYKDNMKFLEMCTELEIIPDIWSLYEWSNWLTPVNMDKLHKGRRYDTAFFICMLPKSVEAVHDEQEIVSAEVSLSNDRVLLLINFGNLLNLMQLLIRLFPILCIICFQWCDPVELINRFKNGELWLAPPQIYELCRLYNFLHFDQLHQFAKERDEKSCERWMPVRINCDDIIIATLPGKLFLKEPN